MTQRNRFWKRWISCVNTEITEIVESIAPGMVFYNGWKPGFCPWIVVAICGTSEQMKQTEQLWTDNKWEWYNRKPKGAFDLTITKTVKEVMKGSDVVVKEHKEVI